MSDLLSMAVGAAARAAALLRSGYCDDAGVISAAGKDIKTRADQAAQEAILASLAPSGIAVLAEEGDRHDVDLDGPLWLVDPLDGTLNFTRGFAMAAVSVALWEGGRPLLGVVHDIFHGEVYSGEVGKGAWLDGRPMRVSGVDDRAAAVLATGFPSGRSYRTESLLDFVRSVQEYKKVRMLGSAALMLAQVAAGRFDAYEEEDIYLWDVAAGVALVSAAGGHCRITPGSGRHKLRVRATNGHI